MFDITKIARPNILTLEPYRCARDDFQEGVLLDANENTYGPSFNCSKDLNRYPDPHLVPLKQRLCDFRNGERATDQPLKPSNICLSVGSDGGIDMLIRCFVKPSVEKVLVCPPTYPMYDTCCSVNDVEMVEEPLDLENFQIRPKAILRRLSEDHSIKLVFITSPGNPTGTKIKEELIMEVIEGVERMSWNGLIVVDEAYIDFCPEGSSFAVFVNKHKNLVVLQTFSKSFALAGIRLGISYSADEVSNLLNIARDPYSTNRETATAAMGATSKKAIDLMKLKCRKVNEQKKIVLERLKGIKGVRNIGGMDGNFILIQILNDEGEPDGKRAYEIYWKMATERKVVVRYRGGEMGCEGCLRVTIGRSEENERLVGELKELVSGPRSQKCREGEPF
ncbi:DEKNAAC105394 [Brettanomyces naardenensis]|uniref:histidinol-phosphate transaminase n=1 Tax=Brettanomyces naardenensis TaxID=13370 RepID=A0A448YTD6_BRENA|nr:DEKNAAC105394 [Brettanomyces naardenensis]